jgi:hypothetical protein
MKYMFFLPIALSIGLLLTDSVAEAANLKGIEGNWEVISTGADCVSTGWVQDQYEPKNGKIIGTKISIKNDKFSWGKLNCKTPKYTRDQDSELEFFDGNECKAYPGTLPKGCADLMKKMKNKKLDSFNISCSGSELIPDTYNVLSKDYILAVADSDYICLKRLL